MGFVWSWVKRGAIERAITTQALLKKHEENLRPLTSVELRWVKQEKLIVLRELLEGRITAHVSNSIAVLLEMFQWQLIPLILLVSVASFEVRSATGAGGLRAYVGGGFNFKRTYHLETSQVT